MTATPPTTPEQIRDSILADEMPDSFISMAAKGFLPVPQEDLLAILIHLRRNDNEEIASDAEVAMSEIPLSAVEDFARKEDSPATALNDLMRIAEDRVVLEALIRNRSVDDETVLEIAPTADARLQEVILTNQRRILNQPEILDALESNPQLTGDSRRRIHEFREEFFIKAEARRKSREEREAEEAAAAAAAEEEARKAEEEALEPEDQAVLDELLADAETAEQEGETLPVEEVEEEAGSAWNRILKMSVSERVQTAFKGDKTERGILIKDRNRLVCSAVIKSPRITETEVEQYAGMRNLDQEVLRLIGANREWMRKYPIMLTLARNPKAPPGVVLPLINRLTLRDLKSLGADKNVPEVIRTSARRLFVQRSKR